MLYLSPSRDEYYMVATGNFLALNRGIQEEQNVPARYRQEFLTIAWEQVHLRSIFPFQYFSIRASLIPFIEHNDANRALISSNMQRQAVPLSRSEKFIGHILADGAATVGGELALGKNVLVAYMPWEGYNCEDVVIISECLVYEDMYTSFHIRKYEIQTHVTNHGPERITNKIPHLEAHLLQNLAKNGIVILGSWVETGDILVGKLTPQMAKESSYAPEDRLLRAILGIQVSTSKETCLKLPMGGDKVAGRHGNKGIVSKILSRQDMPYLQDGRPIDMVFNALGVPSRMNVGQILECSLGLAGSMLNTHYRIAPFDERYEQEAVF
ncbi:putative DNA-directed RNA polymerase [Medicago truncatula]|uniref:DNA-directed RNA polymerase n=1 Tax=Medicago truncatula TaxID=3880 RepID=A0A396JHY0_MEDTR|nr:putative DNA-directed RNA polymerase [Medicago truncatula]